MTTNKQLFIAISELNKARRFEIKAHAHGGMTEVYWSMDDDEIAHGIFGDKSEPIIRVEFLLNGEEINMVFQGDHAHALRYCGSCVSNEIDSDGTR
jgi:hypothetical protein